MNNPAIDKGVLTLVIGPVIGLLVMKGYIEPVNADQLTSAVSVAVGAVIALVTVIVGLHHTREQQKIDSSQTTTQTLEETPTVTVEQPV